MDKRIQIIIFCVFFIISFLTNAFAQPTFDIKKLSDNNAGARYDTYKGTIAWVEGAYGDIHYWDGTSERIINTNRQYINKLSLYNGQIAYDASPSTGSGSSSIMFWDGTSTRKITNSSVPDWSPSLYDGKIAWVHGQSGSSDIQYWDGNKTITVSENHGVYNYIPALYNGSIAWRGEIENPSGLGQRYEQVFYWNGQSSQRLTNDSTSRVNSLDLYNGHVVWENGDGSISFWDGSSIKSLFRGQNPSLYDDKIAFSRGYGIYYYDGNSLYKVTDAGMNFMPVLSGNHIIWMGGENGHELYDAKINGANVPIPAAVWLLGSGLIGLVGMRRKFRK